MPRIIPIKDLKDTATISNMVKEDAEPVYITKNGYGDMVIMSLDYYEKSLFSQDVRTKLAESEIAVAQDKTVDARESLMRARQKYGL
jgi:PHD/YefM family antitoxin component YafN of YafNO toxin-antitoxin module